MRQILQWQKAKGFNEFAIRGDVSAENKDSDYLLQSNFINNRNHVAHNKLLEYAAKEKMMLDTQELCKLIEEATIKFESENISEEIEETLQAIEEQREYEREARLEIIESEAGVVIKDKKEILLMLRDTIIEMYQEILNMGYFDEKFVMEQREMQCEKAE